MLTEEYCFVCSCGMNTAQAPPKYAGNQPKKKTGFGWGFFGEDLEVTSPVISAKELQSNPSRLL